MDEGKTKRPISPAGYAVRIIALIIALFIIAGIVALILLVDTGSWKSFAPQKLTNYKQTLYVYDSNSEVVAGIYSLENRTPISIGDLPEHVKNAFIAIEDARFYKHFGIDLIRFFGSAWQNIKTMSFAEGFSSISQQIIKLTHLTTEKTINRKVQEVYLTLKLEKEYTKSEILEMYLNTVNFGNGAYGIEAAAESYFAKHASELTISEAALLAGIINRPGYYAPHINYEASVERRNLVLSMMAENDFITAEEAEQAKKDVPKLIISRPSNEQFNQYVDAVISNAAGLLSMTYDEIASGGFRIYTTLDSKLQGYCQELFQNQELFPPNAEDGVQCEGSCVVLSPHDGSVIALIGGRDYVGRGINRAVDSLRQPGSAIKPVLVYAPAIEKHSYNGASLINDEPINISGYEPSNYGNDFKGWMSLRYALAESVNIPAVRVLNAIGLDDAKAYAESAGIKFDPEDNNLSLALGGFKYGVSCLNLAASYVPFSNGGEYYPPYMIKRIEDSYGKVVYEHESQPSNVLSSATAFMISDILKSAVSWGTAKRAAVEGVPIAGKTGTVSYKSGMGVNDAWTCCYTTDYVLAIWNGFDMPDDKHFMPSSATGGKYPAMMAHEILAYIYQDETSQDFIKPENVQLVALDKYFYDHYQQILLATEYTPKEYIYNEYFTSATIPTEVSVFWDTPLQVVDLSVALNSESQPVISFTARQNFINYKILRKKQSEPAFSEITALTGTGGAISYIDASSGSGYVQYYVVPFHPLISTDGGNLEGTASNTVSIDVPRTGNGNGWPGWDFLPDDWFNWRNNDRDDDEQEQEPSPDATGENNRRGNRQPESTPTG